MRLARVAVILLVVYLVFVGGSAWYNLIFPVRVIHHALLTGLLALWLIGRLRRDGQLPHSPLNLPIGAAVGVWIASALFSADPRMAFENLWFQLIHVLFFFILVDWLQRGRERLILEATWMVGAVVVLLSGLEFASWYLGLGFIPGTGIGWADVLDQTLIPLELPRLSLAMNISTLLAGFVAPLTAFTAAWSFTARRRDLRVALRLLAALLVIVLVLTFSRGGYLSLLMAVGVFGAFRLIQASQVTGRIPARWIAVGAGFVGVVAVSGFIIFSITQARAGNTGDEGRLDMWQSAVRLTASHPLTGVGPGLFGRAFRDVRDATIVQDKLASAHNAYLNNAAETGLPGVAVGLWLAGAFLWAWFRQWRSAQTPARRMRLEGALAALMGLAVHSLVDVFTITPVVLLSLMLVAYCLVPEPGAPASPEPRRRAPRYLLPGLGLMAVLGYGLWFIQLDRAQAAYLASLRGEPGAIQTAAALDPGLRLYALQEAYQRAQTSTNPQAALEAYAQALALEPSWEIGWLNTAALHLRAGDDAAALIALDRARQINGRGPGSVHWAALAERLNAAPAPAPDVLAAYQLALGSHPSLPLAAFWWESPLRRDALSRYAADLSLDGQYRIWAVHDPARAAGLVPAAPATAPDWWIVGEHRLTVLADPAGAAEAFTRAIALAPRAGDYYVARARARWPSDPAGAGRDLDMATLLGTTHEYPDAVRALLTGDPAQVTRLRAGALPPRIPSQEFAAVLYGGRPAVFDSLPDVRLIGPGRVAMSPWYAVAEARLAAGDREGALNAYRAILDYAPDEPDARARLAALEPASVDN